MDNFNIQKFFKDQYLTEDYTSEYDEETAKRNAFAASYNKPGDTERFRNYMEFLSKLRTSGKTNMFGAAPYLQAEFNLDKKEARKLLAHWMGSYRNPDLDESLNENFEMGDRVKLTPDYEETPGEVFTITQTSGNKYFISDEDGRGWYTYGDQLVMADDELDEDRKAKEYIKSIEDEDEREEERKRMFDNDELDEVELTQDFGELDEDHTKRENDQLKKISKQLKKSVKSHDKQSKIIDKIVKEIKDSQIKISKPRYVKDKNNPNFLNIYIDYETGSGALIALGKETMSGQIRRKSAAAAVDKLNNIAKDLTAKYDVEDIEVTDLENGKAQLFAVSDDFIDTGINEINMNDPVIMRARAARDKQPEPSRGGLDFEDVMYLRDEQKDLEDRIAQLYRDMEQEAEPEGGEIADRYGSMLNKLEDKLYRVKKQINQYDMNESTLKERVVYDNETQLLKAKIAAEDFMRMYRSEFRRVFSNFGKEAEAEFKKIVKDKFSRLQESLNESLNPEVSRKVNGFIKAMAKRYDYSEQDAVFAIMAALKQRMMDDIKEGSCGYTPDGKPRSKPASSDLIKLKEKLEQVNEKLCKKGEAYRKRRMAAGEKSSAYLSGRAVKVCKGQMSGKKKKK